VIALLLLVETIAQRAGMSFITTVILGEDKRTSTSKTFVLMWTLLVAWALVTLLLAGEFQPLRDCVAAAATAQTPPAPACPSDGIGALQLAWQHLLKNGLDNAYLVLLGIPAGAAIAAKAVTQSKSDSGAIPPVPLTADDKKLSARVMQIFSADNGSTDIADFQYAIFNLILAGFFVAEMLRLSGAGLPHLPDTLLGLTTVSAALYVGKKIATRNQPTIAAVFPSFLKPGSSITITGSGLTKDVSLPGAQQPPNLSAPQVMINGVPAIGVTPDPVVTDRITATVPGALNTTNNDTIPGSLEVLTAFGVKTPPFAVTISK
jgi:hypothetical protein